MIRLDNAFRNMRTFVQVKRLTIRRTKNQGRMLDIADISVTKKNLVFVITSINSTSPGLVEIGLNSLAHEHLAIMVGDRKGPHSCDIPGMKYYSIADQRNFGFQTAVLGPIDSYTRKLSGYLIAISSGAEFIRETDDDNNPYRSFFEPVSDAILTRTFTTESRWTNIYSAFTNRHVWPRGMPLDQVREPRAVAFQWTNSKVMIPTSHAILQGLADGDPDVDAIYRLTAVDTSDIIFSQDEPVLLPHMTWTPFNSQATTWPKRLFPLMYLPATCSFRMTDIWRSFVAQRIMREINSHVVYTSPNVFQDRNDHSLMRDFAEEIEGYLGYDNLVNLLESLQLEKGDAKIGKNLIHVYENMINHGFVTEDELPLLEAWLADLASLGLDI